MVNINWHQWGTSRLIPPRRHPATDHSLQSFRTHSQPFLRQMNLHHKRGPDALGTQEAGCEEFLNIVQGNDVGVPKLKGDCSGYCLMTDHGNPDPHELYQQKNLHMGNNGIAWTGQSYMRSSWAAATTDQKRLFSSDTAYYHWASLALEWQSFELKSSHPLVLDYSPSRESYTCADSVTGNSLKTNSPFYASVARPEYRDRRYPCTLPGLRPVILQLSNRLPEQPALRAHAPLLKILAGSSHHICSRLSSKSDDFSFTSIKAANLSTRYPESSSSRLCEVPHLCLNR